MWTSYEQVRDKLHDFEVKYRLYSKEEGGRKATYQGLRCDFLYDGDNAEIDGIYAIHPEFIDEYGNVILETDKPVKLSGTAKMWILFPEMINEVHGDRIKVGVKGYMMEGPRKIGEVEVTKVVGLYPNSHI